MKTYIINLDKDTERLQNTYDCLRRLNVTDIERVSAVYGKNLCAKKIREVCAGFACVYMTRAMIGCALSHMQVWRKLVNDEDATRAFVVEDDIYTKQPFDMIEFWQNLPPSTDADILYLGYIRNTIDLFGYKGQYDINWAHFNYPAGASSYIISKEGAQKLLTYISSKHGLYRPIDEIMIDAMENQIIKTLIHRPPLLFQTSNTVENTKLVTSSINDHSYPSSLYTLCRYLPLPIVNQFDMNIPAVLGIVRFQITDDMPVSHFDITVFTIFSMATCIMPLHFLLALLILFVLFVSIDIMSATRKVINSCIVACCGILTGCFFLGLTHSVLSRLYSIFAR